MLGLSEYYKVQLLTLVVKFAAWYGLEGKAGMDLSPSATKGAHVFALAFTVLVSSPFRDELSRSDHCHRPPSHPFAR